MPIDAVGINATPFEILLDQEYDTAVPVPLNITLPPAHTAAEDGVDVEDTVGNVFTFTLYVAMFEQPFPSVPITVYVLSEVTMVV